jgi:hypothetical protein
MFSRLLVAFAARRLAKHGHDVIHQRIIERTLQIRAELNLPHHPGLHP